MKKHPRSPQAPEDEEERPGKAHRGENSQDEDLGGDSEEEEEEEEEVHELPAAESLLVLAAAADAAAPAAAPAPVAPAPAAAAAGPPAGPLGTKENARQVYGLLQVAAPQNSYQYGVRKPLAELQYNRLHDLTSTGVQLVEGLCTVVAPNEPATYFGLVLQSNAARGSAVLSAALAPTSSAQILQSVREVLAHLCVCRVFRLPMSVCLHVWCVFSRAQPALQGMLARLGDVQEPSSLRTSILAHLALHFTKAELNKAMPPTAAPISDHRFRSARQLAVLGRAGEVTARPFASKEHLSDESLVDVLEFCTQPNYIARE